MLTQNPELGSVMFQEVHKRSQGTFDRAFQELVDDAVGRQGDAYTRTGPPS